MNDDVHKLRCVRLEGRRRDPRYFLGDHRVEQAHLEECFDADILFYDIFFEPTNRHLVAVGPPLGDLQLDIQIYVNGTPVELNIIKRAAKRLHLLRGEVSRIAKQNDILIKANGQRWELSIPENNSGTGHKFTLCAIQKDNREHWIKDWIEHYRKIGVDRVILYDNGSEKLPGVDAIVIPCPYKYGLRVYRRIYGRWTSKITFLQTSLLTICSYKYRSGHLLNFDIDELLQVKSLEKYRERKVIYFDSRFIETKVDGEMPEDYSFRHFAYRNARIRNTAYKTMVRMDELLYAHSPHRAVLKGNFVLGRIILKLRRIGFYLKARLPQKLMERIAPQDEGIFYHYRGINTGWKFDISPFDETTKVVKLKD